MLFTVSCSKMSSIVDRYVFRDSYFEIHKALLKFIINGLYQIDKRSFMFKHKITVTCNFLIEQA